MSYRRFGRARSLRSNRAEHAFGCYVATLFELFSDDSRFLRKTFRKEKSISKKYLSKKVFMFFFFGDLDVNFVVTIQPEYSNNAKHHLQWGVEQKIQLLNHYNEGVRRRELEPGFTKTIQLRTKPICQAQYIVETWTICIRFYSSSRDLNSTLIKFTSIHIMTKCKFLRSEISDMQDLLLSDRRFFLTIFAGMHR
ncbi:hypothetical protein YC2023_115001 [Brassica napus]